MKNGGQGPSRGNFRIIFWLSAPSGRELEEFGRRNWMYTSFQFPISTTRERAKELPPKKAPGFIIST